MNMSKKVAAGIFLGMTALAGSAWAASNGTSDTIIPKDGKAAGTKLGQDIPEERQG